MSEELKPPKVIYLQWEDQTDVGVTWCEDQISDTDIAYVQASERDQLQAELAQAREALGAEQEWASKNLEVARLHNSRASGFRGALTEIMEITDKFEKCGHAISFGEFIQQINDIARAALAGKDGGE